SLKTSIKTITYLSDIGCLEIQGASLGITITIMPMTSNTSRRDTPLSVFFIALNPQNNIPGTSE
ncbi:hypothetical protein ACPB0S_19355, partial [Escherichia coli]|uniref:hypothetical protein n=1 Tax=Escherichia coli TaxID=562 RepID=UPI003C2DEC6B